MTSLRHRNDVVTMLFAYWAVGVFVTYFISSYYMYFQLLRVLAAIRLRVYALAVVGDVVNVHSIVTGRTRFFQLVYAAILVD